jgi:hypothetical protein
LKEKDKRKIPILFQKMNHFESEEDDIRFLKVKIWLMHTLENLNSSFFSKEVVEAAIPSLKNTPILSYIEKNSENEIDFSDHREILVRNEKDGTPTIKYIGSAIGVIPSENNAQFENRLCDDGITREFLTVEGLIWRKFNDPVDILTRDQSKAESMEIAENYEGEFKEDGYFHFSKFSFFGACGLGLGVLPAMQNATIEVNFSEKDFTKEVNMKMECFKNLFSKSLHDLDSNHANISQEGGNNVLEQVVEMLKKYSLNIEDLSAKSINFEDYTTIESLEEKVNEIFTQPKVEFSLTSEQLEDELRRELAEIEVITEDCYGEIYKYSRYSYVDNKLDTNIVIAWDCKNRYLVGFTFAQINDNVEVDSASLVRFKTDYNPMDLTGDPDPNEVVSDDDLDMVSIDMVDYQLKRKEAEMKQGFAVELDALNAKIDEKDEALLQLNEKFTSLNDQLAEKDVKIQSLEQYSKEVEEAKNKDKVEALFKKYSIYFKPEEIDELREKQTSFDKFELFEKEIKSIACDRLVEATKTNKPLHAFTEIPKNEIEVPTEEIEDVFTRLEKKLTQTN